MTLTFVVAAMCAMQSLDQSSFAQNAEPGNVTRPRDRVTEKLDVEYARAGSVSLKLDLYCPAEPATNALPCVVWVHGGGWQGGNNSSGRNQVAPYAASGEYVAASVRNRLTDVAIKIWLVSRLPFTLK